MILCVGRECLNGVKHDPYPNGVGLQLPQILGPPVCAYTVITQ